MNFKNLLMAYAYVVLLSTTTFANDCPKWLPIPTGDGLLVVIPIYNSAVTEPDMDCDGIIDRIDTDIDGDGVLNTSDKFPLNNTETMDSDNDGIGNNADTDDDNDGLSDIEETLIGTNPLVSDTDGDGVNDKNDLYPTDNSRDSDNIAPVITLVGDNNINLEQNSIYIEEGATAIDDMDGNISVIITGSVDTSIRGTYTITYSAVDNAGNDSSAIRTITISDTMAPIITLNGDSNITLALGLPYVEEGATATDNIDGNISVIITGIVDISMSGVYTITYRTVDSAGNEASIIRTITVLDDIAPVITLNGENNITLAQNAIYIEEDGIAIDNVDGNISVIITGLIDTSVIGSYIITYVAIDSFHNRSEINRTINIVDPVTIIRSTGQVQSYDEYENIISDGSVKDDGYYQRGIMQSFVKIENIVKDNLTGLEWQDDEEVGVVKKPWISIANYDNGDYENTSGNTAATYCTQLTLGGYDDWRLPTIKELLPIVMSRLVMSHHHGGDVWSSSTSFGTSYITDNRNAWSWNAFSYGVSARADNSGNKNHLKYVRCVRGDAISKKTFVRDNTLKVVSDLSSALMWADDDSTSYRERWRGAIDYCENLQLAGFENWRLPSFWELESITDRSRFNPAVESAFTDGILDYYITSTTMSSLLGTTQSIHAGSGETMGSKKEWIQRVRCVRDME